MDEKTEEKRIYTEKICNTCGGKKNKQDISIELYPKQKAYLQSIPQAYTVKDEDVSSALSYTVRTLPTPSLCCNPPSHADRPH
jgi:hypothetical protein